MMGRVGVHPVSRAAGKTYCWDVHMVIDGNDELHAAYSTNTSSRRRWNTYFDGTTWHRGHPERPVGPVGIAVDSNNHPHISYAANMAHTAAMDLC